MPNLTRHDLLISAALVGDRFVATTEHGRLAIRDPATGELVSEVPRCGAAEVDAAIDAAMTAYPAFRARGPLDRGELLAALARSIRAHREDLARILTAEQGKPLAEARAEIDYGLTYLDLYAGYGRHLDGEILVAPTRSERAYVQPEPIGLGVAITPWNFPFAMIARKVAPALVAGNVVLVKPAEQTPLVTLAFAKLALEAGIPEGVISVLVGDRDDAAAIGERLVSDPRVRKLSFTGSTAVGKHLYARCAGTVKRMALELGGNAPFLVFEDADLDAAVDGLMASKFRNAGQACVAANRILVADAVHDAFVERLEARIAALRVGPGTSPGVTIGPLIDERGFEKVVRHVGDAVARGAKLVSGGRPHALGRTFHEPTLLVDVPSDAAASREETFGPVAAISRFASEEEAVRMANDTPYGLASYVYARDLARVHRITDALEFGMVAVNAGLLSNALAPFGGVKESGLGKEGGRQGLEDWTVSKYVRVAGLDR